MNYLQEGRGQTGFPQEWGLPKDFPLWGRFGSLFWPFTLFYNAFFQANLTCILTFICWRWIIFHKECVQTFFWNVHSELGKGAGI